MKIELEVAEPFPTCGALSPGGRMRCGYPPDHRLGQETAGHHCGRDSLGRWRTWPVHILDDVWEEVQGARGEPASPGDSPADMADPADPRAAG